MVSSEVRHRNDFARVIDARGYALAVEVGTWEGAYAEVLLSRSSLCKLVCVDPWDGTGMRHPFNGDEKFQETSLRLERFGKRVEIWRATSAIAARQFGPQCLDFVYIDAKHDYDSVKVDLLSWVHLVKPTGILAGHDYNNRRGKGVKRAVDEFFAGTGHTIHATSERCASWYIDFTEGVR